MEIPRTGTGIKTYGDEFSLGGVRLGNVWLSTTATGIPGDPMRLMFGNDLTPNTLPLLSMVAAWLSN